MDRLIRITTAIAVMAVAVVAAVISYQHAYELVRLHGESGPTARLLPFTVDGLIWAASMVVLDTSRRNQPVPLAGPVELKDNVAAGFAAAAEAYDVGGTDFFRPVGQWLVESAQVPAGAWVLDAGCGSGAVTIPAALAAGPKGHVTGIDLAAPMLACAQERACSAGLTNVTFREGDAEDPGTYPGWAPESSWPGTSSSSSPGLRVRHGAGLTC